MISDDRCLAHDAGAGHPERPDRLRAVLAGAVAADLGGDLQRATPTPAPLEAVLRVHEPAVVGLLERLDHNGGGRVDPDTALSAESWSAALLAAGAGLDAVTALDAGGLDAAFCAVRPPGHHATPTRSMGFCLLNNVAVTGMALADRGERVVIIDYDAHHGNGTQDIFLRDQRVLFVSFHQWPLYPGTGALDDVGVDEGVGTTINVPMAPGATGDHYRRAWDDVVGPLVRAFAPTWCLVSAGFDGHRADPITDLGLSSGDFGDLTREIVATVPPGRRVVFLEGGYDLGALAASTASVLHALAGAVLHPEPPTSGGPGGDTVERLVAQHR